MGQANNKTENFGLQVVNQRIVVSSRIIAENFEKRHDNVLRDIANLDCPIDFKHLNFEESSYTNAQCKAQPEYLMTRDGFTLLAMGYTGKKAMEFKIKYIEAFNMMEARIKNDPVALGLPDFNNPIAAARAWIDSQEKVLALEATVEQSKPLVQFAEAVQGSETSILVGALAKLLNQNGVDIGQNRLFKDLRDKGFLIKAKGKLFNLPTQRAMDMALFEVKENTYTDYNNCVHITRTTLVTGKGQIYFVNYYLNGKEEAA